VTGARVDDRPVSLSPELIDLITEAVARPDSAAARAEVIATVLLGMMDAVTWRSGPGGDPSETASLLRVVQAASAHRSRMVSAAGRRG
jgi:hypothetical protein